MIDAQREERGEYVIASERENWERKIGESKSRRLEKSKARRPLQSFRLTREEGNTLEQAR